MQDIISILDSLRRPRLLIRTARFGLDDYRREIHLRRILGPIALPRSGAALMKLMEIEDELNRQRRAEDAAYSPLRHVEVLIAIMGEARVVRTSLPVPA